MKNIPKTCSNCGAPIKWDKSSNFIDCEYCGYTTLIEVKSSIKEEISKNTKEFNPNPFQKLVSFSKNIFLKAKFSFSKFKSSNQFIRNKKLIFITSFLIPIPILSFYIFGKFFNTIDISKNYSPEISCKIPKRNQFASTNLRWIDPIFIGCWHKEEVFDFEKEIAIGVDPIYEKFMKIKKTNNKLNITYWRINLAINKIEFAEISNISYFFKVRQKNYIKFDIKWDSEGTNQTRIIWISDKDSLLNSPPGRDYRYFFYMDRVK